MRLFEAFLYQIDSKFGPLIYYGDLRSPVAVLRTGVFFTIIAIGDSGVVRLLLEQRSEGRIYRLLDRQLYLLSV